MRWKAISNLQVPTSRGVLDARDRPDRMVRPGLFALAPPKGIELTDFHSLGLSKQIVDTLSQNNFATPTPNLLGKFEGGTPAGKCLSCNRMLAS